MIAIYAFLILYALWIFYLAIMCLKRARDTGLATAAEWVKPYVG